MGAVITTESAQEFSSAAKGETLEDTIRVVAGYSDVVVLRHNESGASNRAAAVAGIPVINAGDGAGQHPTQALLDLFTIQREIGHLKKNYNRSGGRSGQWTDRAFAVLSIGQIRGR